MNIPLFLFRKIVLAAITSLFVSSFFIMQAKAQEARLSDIVVTNTNEHLMVYFNVADCFTEEMDKAMENGINTTFTFFVRLYDVKDFE